MPVDSVQVVVIGGGATGTGIIRDLAMRGITCLLVEQGDLAHGTSSRFHGLLHSGARYAVRDGEAARECLEENMILRRIAANCVDLTGGVFVQLAGDDPGYTARWAEACAGAGINIEETDVGELLKSNPVLSPGIARAFKVPDCAVDGFRVLWGNVHSARRYGANIKTYTGITQIYRESGAVSGVELTDLLTGEKRRLGCRVVINAAGAWAGEVASLAGLQVEVIKDKGTLIAFNHRLANRVINRLRPPGDGDIFVPHGTITIFGTTSTIVNDPSCTETGHKEVTDLIRMGKEILPGIEGYRLLRAFAGVRPLYQSGSVGGGRSVTRNFTLLDHGVRDGLSGFFSIVGGKFTTARLMAEQTVDLAAHLLGVKAQCRTADEPLMIPNSEELLSRGKKTFGVPGAKMAADRLGDDFSQVLQEAGQSPEKRKIICECEMVSQAEIDFVARQEETHTLGDIRRKTRMGMGTCQGTFCSLRALGSLGGHERFAGNHRIYLDSFLQGRWKGIRPVLWGQQIREAQLSLAIYCTLYGMERMK
ncbi:MAG: anaerobic glycerol-3-phosphate dehydrogenase subunit GlpA [Desulfocucumaceae bacterium]